MMEGSDEYITEMRVRISMEEAVLQLQHLQSASSSLSSSIELCFHALEQSVAALQENQQFQRKLNLTETFSSA